MRITKLTTYRLAPRWMFLKIDTDAGISGWGEAFGYGNIAGTKATLDEFVTPQLLGRDARQIGPLMFDMQQRTHNFGRNGPVIYALSGVDIALWDIAGKAAGKPVYELLGGAQRNAVNAYSSLVRYTDPALVAKNTAASIERGYEAVKLHEITEPAVRAARGAGGAQFKLTVDCNCPWPAHEALAMARAFKAYDLYWLEEPVWPPENHTGLALVQRESGIALAAGENAASVMDFRHMFEANAVTFAQPSVTKIGGITELRKVAALAEQHNVRLMPHSPYFGPGFVATLQVLATWPHDTFIERLYFDLEASPYGDLIDPVQGKIRVPDGPGLGLDPDPAVLKKYCA